MKKLALASILLFASSLAAQVQLGKGVQVGGAPGGGGTPGGTTGQTQYNNAGSFGGYTPSGDMTVNPATGVVTFTTVNSGPGSCGDATHVCVVTTDGKGRVLSQSAVSITAGTTLAGDVTGPSGSNTAVKVNGGSIPASQPVVGTNSSGQFIAPAAQSAGSFFSGPCGSSGVPTFRGICLSDLPNSSIQHLAGMSMQLDFLPQHISGSTYQDQSGNANDATAGATPPVSTSIGITNSLTSSINLPSAVNSSRTLQWAVKIDPFNIVGAFATYVGGSAISTTDPLFFEGGLAVSPVTFDALPALSIYNTPGGLQTSSSVYASTGNHDFIVTCGTSSGDKTRFYFDGVEVTYAAQTFNDCGNLTTGNYIIGSNPNFPGGGFVGTMYEFITRSAELTPIQVAQEHLAMQADIFLRGVGNYGVPWNNAGPYMVGLGDSLTTGIGGTTNWFNNFTLAASLPTFTRVNLGNPGKSASAINYSSSALGLTYCNSNHGPNLATTADGTNDFAGLSYATGSNVAQTLADQIQLLTTAGCKVFVGTMISRGNAGGAPVNGQTWAFNKNDINAQIRQLWKAWGATGIIDFAADPIMGSDTGNANLTYYNTDQIHPTDPGYALMATAASNSVNYSLGSSRSSPSFIATTPYTMLAGDGYIEATISGNAVFTLPSCIGQSGAIYTINNSTGFSITLKNSVTSQPINGVDYSSTGLVIPTNFSLWDIPNSGGSGGCHWSSTSPTIISPATVAPLMDSSAAVGTSLLYARQDHVHPSDTSLAPKASPTFTGTVVIPALTLSSITGSAQCIHVNTSGVVSGTAADCFSNPMTTVGDIIVGGSAGAPTRIALGANGTFLGVSGGVMGYYTPAGTGTVTHTPGALTALKCVIGNGSADITVDPSCATDGAGNLTTTSVTTNGTGVASQVNLIPSGTSPATVTGAASLGVPNTVTTPGVYLLPAAPATGIWHASNASGIVTDTLSAVDLSGADVTGTLAAARFTVATTCPICTVTIASGTSALGTGAIASAACATVVTTSATGTATTDVVQWGFNGDPTGVTGYAPVTTGALTIFAYPSANNVNYKVCNLTSASITPGAITLNWRVAR